MTRSIEVGQIVRHLADLPGSDAVSVLSRRFTRYSPAERAAYHEDLASYPTNNVPATIPILSDPDEIIITLKGKFPDPDARDGLFMQLQQLLMEKGLDMGWESRAEQPAERDYSLTVFTTAAAPLLTA